MLLLGNLQVQIINVHMEPEIIMRETMKESLKDTVAFSKKDYMMKDDFMHTNTQIRKCNCNTTHTTVLRPFLRDYPRAPVPEETITQLPS